MYRGESRSQEQRSWQGTDDQSQDEGSRRSMQTAENDEGQQGRSWQGYVVPYRYYGPGYRGVGYYSVMYLGPTRSEGESRGEFDQRNVDYGQGQGAGAAWSGSYGRGGTSGGYAGRGPKGYQRSDQRIEEEINDRLMADDRIDASEIQVKVKNGEVTLSGTVDDRDAKRRAEDVADQVMGVVDVMNQLKVSSAGSWSRSGSTQGAEASQGPRGRSSSGTTSRSTSRNGGRSTDQQTASTSSSR